MEELELGPNGSLIYCMEYLYDHIDWLLDKLEYLCINKCDDKSEVDKILPNYILFDCPGQVCTMGIYLYMIECIYT